MPRLAPVGVTLVAVLAAGCGGTPAGGPAAVPPPAATAPVPAVVPATASPSTAPRPGPSASPPAAAPDPLVVRADAHGRQPQTRQRPVEDRAFQERVQALWQAVATRRPPRALGAFFPRAAYLQVKAIRDPGADWRDRLLRLFTLDLVAAADSVPAGSRLLGAAVPEGAATWVGPGEEYNALGYWRVYGTRVRYRTPAGVERSFGVCSMISWRGDWYVVHLGPVSRNGPGGALC